MSDESSSAPTARPGRGRRPLVLGGGAVVLAVVAGGLVWRGTAGSAGSAAAAVPRFVDETVASGVDHAYEGGFEFFEGAGVAVFDCDDDGRPELFFAGGSSPAVLYRNASDVGGALRFEPLASPVTDLVSVTGAYPLDVDGDRTLDLAVLRHAEGNRILRGLGDCRFEDATDALGLEGGTAQTMAFSATWEAGNRLPTLAFGNYLVPGTYDCDTSVLVRPDATGERYGAPIPLPPGNCPLSMLFSDWRRVGHQDLRVANDRHYYRVGGEQLWDMTPGAEPRLFTEADGWRPLQLFGMGLASADLTGDGFPEIVITNQGDNKLQTLESPGDGVPTYRDIALERGTLAQRPYTGGDVLPSTAWHAEFEDVNADGRLDLFIAKGNVEAQPDFAAKDPSNLLIQQADGTFREGGEQAGIVRFDRARGGAVTDLNLDGLPDLVITHRLTPVALYRNVGAGTADAPSPLGNWTAVRVRQPAPNVDAVGAWVDLKVGDRVSSREITVGGGHAGGEAGWLHLGLGDATSAEIRVQWPGGDTGPWMPVDAGTFVVVERDATVPTVWTPPA